MKHEERIEIIENFYNFYKESNNMLIGLEIYAYKVDNYFREGERPKMKNDEFFKFVQKNHSLSLRYYNNEQENENNKQKCEQLKELTNNLKSLYRDLVTIHFLYSLTTTGKLGDKKLLRAKLENFYETLQQKMEILHSTTDEELEETQTPTL